MQHCLRQKYHKLIRSDPCLTLAMTGKIKNTEKMTKIPKIRAFDSIYANQQHAFIYFIHFCAFYASKNDLMYILDMCYYFH